MSNSCQQHDSLLDLREKVEDEQIIILLHSTYPFVYCLVGDSVFATSQITYL